MFYDTDTSATAGYYTRSDITASSTDFVMGNYPMYDNGTAAVTGGTWYPDKYIYTYITTQPAPETKKHKLARLKRQKKWERWQEKLRLKREAAAKRAEELLQNYLGLESFGKLYEVGYIEVDSRKYPGRKYRVSKETSKMIEVLDETGKVIDRLCVQPKIECPAGDHILTKVAFLQMDEESILTKANHHRV